MSQNIRLHNVLAEGQRLDEGGLPPFFSCRSERHPNFLLAIWQHLFWRAQRCWARVYTPPLCPYPPPPHTHTHTRQSAHSFAPACPVGCCVCALQQSSERVGDNQRQAWQAWRPSRLKHTHTEPIRHVCANWSCSASTYHFIFAALTQNFSPTSGKFGKFLNKKKAQPTIFWWNHCTQLPFIVSSHLAGYLLTSPLHFCPCAQTKASISLFALCLCSLHLRGSSNSLYWKRQKPDSGISSQRSDVWKQWVFIFIPRVKILWRWVIQTRPMFRKAAVSRGRLHRASYVTAKLQINVVLCNDGINNQP